MKVIIQGSWASYLGTDYCDALGVYDSLDEAREDAETYAWDRWVDDEDDYEDGEYVGEGPDYWIEEYDPVKHDMFRAGGGSFEDDFFRLTN